MQSLSPHFRRFGRQFLILALCAGAVSAAGCHSTSHTDSGYGIGWVTVANGSGSYGNNVRFASYVVNIDSVELTDPAGNVYTAISTVEPVDLVKLSDIAELWGNATLPADTYVSATITFDYTEAQVSLLVDGVPTAATVAIPEGDTALTSVAVTVLFDPNNPLVVTDSYATTTAQRFSLDFDLAASNVVDLTTTPATVHYNPFVKFSGAPADTRQIRIRGPLINSNVSAGTYSIYERPFYDEANNIGSLSVFNGPNTIYTINGTTYVGADGLAALTQVSAGVTATEAYTSFEVTPSTKNAQGQPTGTAGIFNSAYVVAGGSLETNYTENMEGDVIARNGNTLTLTNVTLAGATVALSEGYFQYIDGSTTTNVTVGPTTVVTAEGDSALTKLDYNSIAVGQHITAIGTYTVPATNVITLDAVSKTTGSTSGQVRIQSTALYGQAVNFGQDSLTLNLQYIDNLPVSVFNFAGDGASAGSNPSAAAYSVNTAGSGATGLSSLAAGSSLWVDGYTNAFGAAPPDFSSYPNLKLATRPTLAVSGVNTEAVVPASLQVVWKSTGTTTPFATSSSTAVTVSASNAALVSGVIQVGPEIIPLSSLASAVTVVPNTVVNCVDTGAANPQPCQTLFAYSTVATAATSSVPATTTIVEFNSFATFISSLNTAIATTNTATSAVNSATQLVANGYYDRATNTFTANSVDVVL